jgi:adenosylcobyric acid synthase
MLGKRVADPEGMEGAPGVVEGLGLLDVETVLTGAKTLERVTGENVVSRAPFAGYEMHIGRTTGPDCARPLLRFSDGRSDGAIAPSGRVMGAYVHGLFADDRQRAAFLHTLGADASIAYETTVEATLDGLADHLETHLDCDGLLRVAR